MCIECTYNNRKPGHRVFWTIDSLNEFLDSEGRKLKFDDPNSYLTTQTKTWCLCLHCGYRWLVTPNSILNGGGCAQCAGNLKWNDARLDQYLTDENIPIERLGHIKSSHTPILCRCKKCNHTWKIAVNNIMQGNLCPQCALKFLKERWQTDPRRWTNERFDAFLLDNDIPFERLGKVTGSLNVIQCRCKICQLIWNPRLSDIVNKGNRCPQCSGKLPWTDERFDRVIKDQKMPIKRLGNVHGAFGKVQCLCLLCNKEWSISPDNLNHGKGCPEHRFSKNELMTMKFLLELCPQYCNEPDFHDGCWIQFSENIWGRPDFKLNVNGKTVFIEYNGLQHYGPVEFFGGVEKYESYQVPRDVSLEKWCSDREIPLFKIDGREITGEKIKPYIIENILCKLPS